jgi:hypothetical protein
VDVPREQYEALARALASDQGPAGIDAKKRHGATLHVLLDLRERPGRLERRLDEADGPR